ncbi:MAG: hypothetical protein ACOCUU_00895 [Nanoarchaeota archaeon]
MKILDFFKKLKQTKDFKEKERINSNGISEGINKEEKINIQEKRILEEIKERINLSEKEIKQRLEELNATESVSEKPEGRIGTIVKKNLENYIYYVEEFLKELEKIKKEDSDLENIFNKFSRISSNFEKKSRISYQKANYLVKRELSRIKISINKLYKELDKILKKNKKILDYSRTIKEIKTKEKEKQETNKKILELNKKIENLNQNLENLEKSKQKKYTEISETKKTREYSENLKKIKEKELLQNKINSEISGLKQSIDFKNLVSFFHKNKEELDKIKFYKEHFHSSFINEKDRILDYLKQAKMISPEIKEKINKIEKYQEESFKIKQEINPNFLEDLERDLEKIESDIKNLENEKDSKENVLKKLENKKQSLEKDIQEKKLVFKK